MPRKIQFPRFDPPPLTPEQVQLLDQQETETLAGVQSTIIDVYKHHRKAGMKRGLATLGICQRVEYMLPNTTLESAASVIAVLAIKIADQQLAAEGFED